MSIDQTVWDQIRKLQRPGRPDVLAQVLTTYLNDSVQLIENLQTAFEDQNAQTINQVAHRLKSSSASLGAIRLADLCKEVELLGRDAALEQAGELIPQLVAEYGSVCESMKEYLLSNKSS